MEKTDCKVSADSPGNDSFLKTDIHGCMVTSLVALLMIVFPACGGTATDNSALVHMGTTNFLQPSITIRKGEKIILIDDSASIHIIGNGTWEQGTGTSLFNARSYQEPGAPKVSVQVTGDRSQTIGPFNTAGTFHLYCLVHPGMNLTVMVK